MIGLPSWIRRDSSRTMHRADGGNDTVNAILAGAATYQYGASPTPLRHYGPVCPVAGSDASDINKAIASVGRIGTSLQQR